MRINKFLLIMLAFTLPLSSCTQKKDRLSADTLTLAISPSTAQTAGVGEKITLKAVCKSEKSDDVEINPAWSVDSSLGTFSPSVGKITTFTASAAGSGKIYVSNRGITASVPVTVTNTSALVGTLQYVLLADAQAATDLTRDGSNNVIFNYFDTDNAAPWQIAAADSSPGCPVDLVKSTKLDYTYGGGAGWGGFYLAFTAAKDLTAYTKLSFYIKGASGGEKLKVGMVDSNDPAGSDLSKVKLENYITVSTSWQKVDIPFADLTILDKTIVTQPFIIAFEDAYTAASATVYIDYIGFE